MKNNRSRTFSAVVLAFGLGVSSAQAAAPSTPQKLITGKSFTDIAGTTIAALTNNAKFPNNPDAMYFYPYFEWDATGDISTPANNAFSDNYGAQMVGYFYPPSTGDYNFWISADDNAVLYLSTDADPANKKLIAQETAWSNARQYDTSAGNSTLASKDSSQFATTQWPTKDASLGGAKITLQAGRAYYIEALFKEGGGGDNLSVAVHDPGSKIDSTAPIPGDYLSSDRAGGVATIATQPQSQTVGERGSATFRVLPDGMPPYTYQWRKGGTAIAGATGLAYTVNNATVADNNTKYSVVVSGAQGTATSQEATLTVTADTIRPTILSIKGSPNLTEIVVNFSEKVDPTSANTAANYQISSTSGALNVSAAKLSAGGSQVVLTTAKQTLGTKYTMLVSNIKDTAAAPNTIVASTKAVFFPTGKLVEVNKFIVFEAENYDRNLDDRWIRDTTRGTPSGGVSMVVPNGGGGSESATQLEYDVEFKQAATYKIWYRASGNDGSDDSAWFHIDGDKPAERVDGRSAAMVGFDGALNFVWLSQSFDGPQPMSVDIAAPGPHVVGLALREDGSYFDKFIITTDTAFTPTGFGPPETREGAPGPPTVTLTGLTEGQRFSAGANITLSANASGATGVDLARVEFLANGTVVGTATQSPFTVTWSGAKDGTYSILAKVTDEVGSATTSAAVTIKVGNPPPLIYFVTADAGPLTYAGDIAVQQRLLKRGFDVRLARGSDVPADGSSAAGSSLIIQSSSLGSGTVENNGVGKFRFLDIPAMDWEASSEDAFAFQGANGTTTAGQTQINIVDSTHPLAAGLPKGLVTVSASEPYSQGTPEGAHVIATLADDPTQAVIYYYEKGEKGFNGFVMPARRVFFFFGDNTAAVATAEGLKLFDAAVDWLLGGAVVPPKPAQFTKIAKNADGSITLEWTGGGTLQAAASITGPWQDVPGAASPYKFTPAAGAPMLFGRIKN